MKATPSSEMFELHIFQNKVAHSTRRFSKQQCVLSSLPHFSLLMSLRHLPFLWTLKYFTDNAA
jgi:hypothetical protein